jgi:hypothetical protein
MKKALSIIAAAAVLFSATPVYATADVTITSQQFAACDFNSDGYVDTIDLLFLAMVSLPNFDAMRGTAYERVGFTDEMEQKILKYGDFNGNGSIDNEEGTAFLDYMTNNTECKIDDLSLSDMTEMTKLMDPSKKTGDIDGDDIINAVDASNVLRYYAITSTGAYFDTVTMLAARHKGDMNGNRIVDSVDAALILKKYAENSVAK